MNYIEGKIGETIQVTVDDHLEAVLKAVHRLQDEEEFEEFKIIGHDTEMLRVPTAMSAFRGYGRIKLKLAPFDSGTSLTCEILPCDNNFTYILLFGTLWLLPWIFAGYALSGNPLLVIGAGYGVTIIGMLLYLILNKLALRSFSKYLISKISN